jgi:O-antigen ligase
MTRSVVIFLISFIALLSSLSALFLNRQSEAFELRGYVNPVESSNLPFCVPRFGANVELSQYTDAELDEQLRLMEASGITWVRQFARWDELEPRQGVYNWDEWDRLTAAIRSRPALRLVAVLMNTPEWARPNPTDTISTPPKDNGLFSSFAGSFGGRYGAVIDYYQIWDEPNLRDAWGGNDPQVAAYVSLLAAAHHAIHGADVGAIVIAAALAPTTEQGPHNISDIAYLRQMYQMGAADYFDAAAGKPYGFASPPDDRRVDESTLNFSRLVALREVMETFADAKTSLWAMNWGWNSLPTGWSGSPSIWGSVNETDQIRYTFDALRRAEREWPWLGGMIIQHWQPYANPDDPMWGFALVNSLGEPSSLLAELIASPPAFLASNGLFEPLNPFARYAGVWSFGELGADVGWTNGSQASFTFSGSKIGLLLREGNFVAYLYPTIDDLPPDDLPHDNDGNAYIVLTSDTQDSQVRLIPLANDLSTSQHTLHLVPYRGWDQWVLVGYAVSDGDLRIPYSNLQIIALAIGSVAGIVSLSSFPISYLKRIVSQLYRATSYIHAGLHWLLGGIASLILMIGMLLTWIESVPAVFRREPVQLTLSIFSAGLIYIQPGIWITVIAIVILWWLIYSRLEIGLALTIFWSPFFLFPVELYRFAFPLAEIIVLLTISAWLVGVCMVWAKGIKGDRAFRLRLQSLHSLDWCVLIWVAAGLLSLLWTQYPQPAVTELRVLFLEPALFYLVLRSINWGDSHALRYCLGALIVAGVAVSIIGFVQFTQGQAIITAEDGALRMASVYGSPNNLGLFLGRCIPFVLALAIIAPHRRIQLLAALLALIMGVATLLSQSAGAIFIGVPVGGAVVIMLSSGRRGFYAVIVLAVIGGIALSLALQSPRFARLLDFSSGTNFFRLRVWESSIDVIRDYPLTGLGLDQFLYAFRGQYIRPDAWQEPNLSHPHNIILDFWIRLGLLGLGLLIAFQVAFWKAIWDQYKAIASAAWLQKVIVIGGIGSMANLIAHGMIDNSIYVNDLIYVFMVLLAICCGQVEHECY